MIGVIITTRSRGYIFAKQCIMCCLKSIQHPSHVVLIVDGVKDKRYLTLQNEFPNVIVHVSRNELRGGIGDLLELGVQQCLEQGCTTVLLTTDDVVFNESITHMAEECEKAQSEDRAVVFTPVVRTLKLDGTTPEDVDDAGDTQDIVEQKLDTNHSCGKSLSHNCFLGIPAHVLKANKDSDGQYFKQTDSADHSYCDWVLRFVERGGEVFVCKSTRVYFYNVKQWKRVSKNTPCVYTINLGGYEEQTIREHTTHYRDRIVDRLYFTDDFEMVEKCFKLNIAPLLVFPDQHNVSCKVLQRTIKTAPHHYLPWFYNVSVYVDGNCLLTLDSLDSLLDTYGAHDCICYEHPAAPRETVRRELRVIERGRYETPENVQKIRQTLKDAGFLDINPVVTETNMLIRRHHDIKAFSDEWSQMIRVCVRDQASFDYLLWKHKINYVRLPYKDKPVKAFRHKNPHCRRLCRKR